jgi:hypothetical protein
VSTRLRTANLVMLSLGGVIGLVSAFARGFWPVAPLLVIVSCGLAMHLMPPLPKDQPGLLWWAVINLVGLVVALTATWFESLPMLITGLLLVGAAIAIPSLQRKS